MIHHKIMLTNPTELWNNLGQSWLWAPLTLQLFASVHVLVLAGEENQHHGSIAIIQSLKFNRKLIFPSVKPKRSDKGEGIHDGIIWLTSSLWRSGLHVFVSSVPHLYLHTPITDQTDACCMRHTGEFWGPEKWQALRLPGQTCDFPHR